MKTFLFLIFSVTSILANADSSGSFNYERAKAAFGNSGIPSQNSLLGSWFQVGAADSDSPLGKYATDGWFKGRDGTYRTEIEFSLGAVDPFGVVSYNSVFRYFELSKGKTGDSNSPEIWSDKVVSYTKMTKTPKGETICADRVECHLLGNGLLLCQTRPTGNSDCDNIGYRYYSGWARVQP